MDYCGTCEYNDGNVYTSIPVKYRCTLTNEYHLATDTCNYRQKEIHFYTYKDVKYNNYIDSWNAIQRGELYIETSQMSLLCFDLQAQHGYDIYIHDGPDDSYLVSYDERQCERTTRQLRVAHNLEKLWMAGEFSK